VSCRRTETDGREDLRTEELRTAFERAFDAPPELVVRSPGRVNLIGEHTDYNDGFTLPVALDLGTDVAVRRRPDGLLRTVARQMDATDTRPIDALRPAEGPERARYVAGAAALLRESRGNLPGAGRGCLVAGVRRPVGPTRSARAPR
jgi:galactokinase